MQDAVSKWINSDTATLNGINLQTTRYEKTLSG